MGGGWCPLLATRCPAAQGPELPLRPEGTGKVPVGPCSPAVYGGQLTTLLQVIQRIFYTVNRSWSGRITCAELRRSSFLQVGSWPGGKGGGLVALPAPSRHHPSPRPSLRPSTHPPSTSPRPHPQHPCASAPITPPSMLAAIRLPIIHPSTHLPILHPLPPLSPVHVSFLLFIHPSSHPHIFPSSWIQTRILYSFIQKESPRHWGAGSSLTWGCGWGTSARVGPPLLRHQCPPGSRHLGCTLWPSGDGPDTGAAPTRCCALDPPPMSPPSQYEGPGVPPAGGLPASDAA